MKRYIWGLTLSFAVLTVAGILISGCTAARKPEPDPQPRTFVVPEVSRVDFDTVDLEKAPKVVRDVARGMRDRDAATWIQSGDNTYIVVSLGKNSKDRKVEVDEILQRIPEPDTNWLDVKLKYAKQATGQNNGDETRFTVVRADVNDRPEAVGFETIGFEMTSQAAPAPARQNPAPVRPAPAPRETGNNGAEISQPAPNQEVTSPLKVSGKLNSPAEKVRVRVMTRTGQIMKEEEMPAPSGTGPFETSISYNAPSLPKPGVVEIISVDADGNDKILARVPVLIK